jgi:hypothetical protein
MNGTARPIMFLLKLAAASITAFLLGLGILYDAKILHETGQEVPREAFFETLLLPAAQDSVTVADSAAVSHEDSTTEE